MSQEHPVKLQPRKKSKKKSNTPVHDDKICIVHFERNKTDTVIKPLTERTFDKIKSVASKRQVAEGEHIRLDEICRSIPDGFHSEKHGIHRWCYQSFTNVSSLGKRKRESTAIEVTSPRSSKRTKPSSTNRQSVLFPNECVFCDKVNKMFNYKNEPLQTCEMVEAEKKIKQAAEIKNDSKLLCKIQGQDLVARECKYHHSCRVDHIRILSENKEESQNEAPYGLVDAHRKAFDYLCSYVDSSIVKGKHVERMTMLREKYLLYMKDNNPEFYNPLYKTDKLKDKLKRRFTGKLQFWQPNYRSELIYSTSIPKGQAIETAFTNAASDERLLEDCALILRRNIFDFKNRHSYSAWPPSAKELLASSTDIPDLLHHFLLILLCGKCDTSVTKKSERIANSYGQDICYSVTNGRLKTPKHLLLGMTLRHLTGSAELLTLLNHFGHCQSYTQMLELETCMCNETLGKDTPLPTAISAVNNLITHLCWDNFDLNEETPSGAGTTHTAHGIVIQERAPSDTEDVNIEHNNDQIPERDVNEVTAVPSDETPSKEIHSGSYTHEIDGSRNPIDAMELTAGTTEPSTSSDRKRSIKYQSQELDACFITGKPEPAINTKSKEFISGNTTELANSSDFIWFMCRKLLKDDKQLVPSWAGWVSLTAELKDQIQSTVEYMPPINSPITENATVQKVLQESQRVSRAVGQQYTFVTFDLAVAKKAYAITWQYPVQYKDVIVHLGAFHTLASYLAALGKQLRGCGFSEVLIESGVCASGSIEQVLSGKHYNRAMRVHKLTVETLERLLFEAFETHVLSNLSDGTLDDAMTGLRELSQNPNDETLKNVTTDNSVIGLYQKYLEFKADVRQCCLGKTAQFWLDYSDKVWLILRFLRATKENNLDLYISSLQDMVPLFFAYDHQNYARYLSVYLLMLTNIDETHPGARDLLTQNGFSVSRSNVPGSRNAIDITIEQTINRHAKSRGGIIGFSRNYAAYYRWCLTRHTRASYVEATFDLAGMSSSESTSHNDIRPASIAASEKDVGKLLISFENFLNPFNVENRDCLYCISSGSPAPKDVEESLLTANRLGEAAHQVFVRDRLVEKTVSFHTPLRRQNLKTFDIMKKTQRLTSSQKKMIEVKAERNLFGQLVLLSEENDISLEKTLTYPLGPVPWALATADGSPTKTDKSKLMHHLEKDLQNPDKPSNADMIYIYDGNALLQALTGIPPTFEELAERVFEALSKCERVDFVTDSYRSESIKSSERDRRGTSATFLVKGHKTKVPRDLKGFLCNNENKKQLIRLLVNEWSKDKYAERLKGRRIFYAYEEECKCLSSNGSIVEVVSVPELHTNQEEADTRMILHLQHASREQSRKKIIVRSPDTDVLILLVKFAQGFDTVLFDTGVGNRRRLIDVQKISGNQGDEMVEALPGLHAFTGYDTTSAFVRQGKLKPKKVLEKRREFVPVFKRLGNSLEICDEDFELLEQFVCCMYGKPRYMDINKLRVDTFRQKFKPNSEGLTNTDGIDLSLLPPCRASLRMHILRANYQTFIWKKALEAFPVIPGPIGHGWKKDEAGLVYDWTEGYILPPELLDILAKDSEQVMEPSELINEEEDDDDIDENIDWDNYIDIIFDDEYESDNGD